MDRFQLGLRYLKEHFSLSESEWDDDGERCSDCGTYATPTVEKQAADANNRIVQDEYRAKYNTNENTNRYNWLGEAINDPRWMVVSKWDEIIHKDDCPWLAAKEIVEALDG